jgi:hypothetical protein
MEKVYKYYSKNVKYNSVVHLIGGIGVGILITHPLIDPHTMRWGLGLLVLGILGHLYPLTLKK